MATNTTACRRHTNSKPTFLQVALRPYRRDSSEPHIVINTRTIQEVSPPGYLCAYNLAGELTKATMSDPRYTVTFKKGRERVYGKATSADLVAAGIPLPPVSQPATTCRP